MKNCDTVAHMYNITFYPHRESSRVSVIWHLCVRVSMNICTCKCMKTRSFYQTSFCIVLLYYFLRKDLSLMSVQLSCDILLFPLSSDICSLRLHNLQPHKYNLWTYRKQAFLISFLILGVRIERLVYVMDAESNQHYSLSHPTVLPQTPLLISNVGLKRISHILKLTLKTYSLTSHEISLAKIWVPPFWENLKYNCFLVLLNVSSV